MLLPSYGIGGVQGMNTLSVYRGEGFVQGVKDVIGADDLHQAMTVQIGPQR